MRYGNPSIASRLEALQARGCDRVLMFALYPQYCAATTATVYDKAFDALKTMRWQPAVRTVLLVAVVVLVAGLRLRRRRPGRNL